MESQLQKTVRFLRITQVICIVLAFICTGLIGEKRIPNNAPVRPVHWAIVLGAAYCAVSGFTAQRKLAKGPARARQLKNNAAPFGGWRAGNAMRLYSALSIVVWGVVMNIAEAPMWMAYCLAAAGVLLLVLWRPGALPAAETVRN